MTDDRFAKLRWVAWRDAMRVLALQALALVVATLLALLWGTQVALGVLIGAAIGLLANAYLAFALLGKPMLTGRFGDVRIGWLVKVMVTIGLLWLAMRSRVAPPPAFIAGLFATMVAQWLAVSFWLRGRG